MVKLLTIAAVAITLVACGTNPDAAFDIGSTTMESDFRAPVAELQGADTFEIAATCHAVSNDILRCVDKDDLFVGDIQRTRVAEAIPTEPAPEIDFEEKFIEIACVLCARLEGRDSRPCDICNADDTDHHGRRYETM